MPVLKLYSGFALAPTGVEINVANCVGDSNVIFNTPEASEIYLLSSWALLQAAGFAHIRSPRMHDNVVGLLRNFEATGYDEISPIGTFQKLYPSDTLQISVLSASGAGVYELINALIYYSDLPGASARLETWDSVKTKIKNIVIVPILITPGVTSDYSGVRDIRADFDPFKGETDYALLGYKSQALSGAIRWYGPDTANTGLGGPLDPFLLRFLSSWFVRLSEMTGLPTIPIINSSNKFSTFIDTFGNDTAAPFIVDQIFGELSS
jgi:hypothetical protein